jgi:hypothetical protein
MTLTSLRKIALFLLFLSAIFEPADRVFGMKVELFSLFVLLGVVALFVDENASIPSFPQLLYVFALALVFPAFGLAVSLVFNPGSMGTDGLQYFKSHLFLVFSIFLTPPSLLDFAEKTFIRLLVLLGHVIIALFLISIVVPLPIYDAIVIFGNHSGMFLLGQREYAGVHFPTTYYVTSPLLVFCLPYYLERANRQMDKRTLYMIAVSFAGLFLSGTRNNILISLLIPAYYLLLHRRGRVVLFLTVPLVIILGASVLRSMFDPEDVSNAAKLAYLSDYSAIFSNAKNLLIGQGLGTRFFASGLGEVVSITELSYFEVIRTYGIFVGAAFFLYLVYPLFALVRACDPRYYVTVGYAAYLIESYSNPYLLSSNGMLVLGLVASLTFSKGPRRAADAG